MTSALDSVAPRRLGPDLAAGGLVLAAFAAATWWLTSPAATYLVGVGLMYLALSVVFVLRPPPRVESGEGGLGAANRITLGRAAMTLVLAGLVGHPLGVIGRWWVIVLGTVIMVLDGLDGRVARRSGTSTEWGARFDMETDAFLLMVLSVLVWLDGRVGAWVLLIGGLRYLFVVAGFVVDALRAPLFESLRRKVVCVVGGIALLVSLGPIIPDPLAVAAAGLGLASLVWSFAVDTHWLLRGRTS